MKARGVCPFCDHEVALRADLTMHGHVCEGTPVTGYHQGGGQPSRVTRQVDAIPRSMARCHHLARFRELRAAWEREVADKAGLLVNLREAQERLWTGLEQALFDEE